MSVRSDLRAAAMERDGGCRWDVSGIGALCRGPLEMAHLEQLSQGGPDELENVVMLCKGHHDLLDNRHMSEKWDGFVQMKRRADNVALLRKWLREDRPWEHWW